jgi:predicted N-formylglutamate amidohydrolase
MNADQHFSHPQSDEASIEEIGGRRSGLVLICEHAGREVPEAWNRLGLGEAYFNTHFSHDIGAAELTRALSTRLDAPAFLARYSRLFYDINRGSRSWDCIRPDMGGIPVPGNQNLTDAERDLRDALVREPFDRAAIRRLRPGDVLVGIHSFSGIYDGKARRTEIGVLRTDGCRTGQAMLDWLKQDARFVIGDNDPYDLRKVAPGTTTRIQAAVDVEAIIIEVRNDIIDTAEGVEQVAACLADAFSALVSSKEEVQP